MVALLLGLGGCNNEAATTGEVFASGTPVEGAGGAHSEASSGQYAYGYDALNLLGSDSGGAAGIGGADADGGAGPPSPVVAPFGTSTSCGDAIVGPTEECDDGPGQGLDACTEDCQTRDQPAAAPAISEQVVATRELGFGRHPIAGGDSGFIATFQTLANDEPAISGRLFDIWGRPAHEVMLSSGASPLDVANPVAAALPGGRYVVAWSDFDGDGSDLGVALRLVKADGSVGALGTVNSQREFSQLNADLVWTGTQLVAAWEDYSDAASGPDLRFRTFDAGLNPTSADQTLAGGPLPEAAVALARFDGGWAAAYREGTASGGENIVVYAKGSAYPVGPVNGGPLDDRPALVELDASHLLVVFSATQAATPQLPRLRYAVIDTQSTSLPAVSWLDPRDAVLSAEDSVAQLSPSAERTNDGVYIAWRSEARPGDAAGDQVWLKHLRWQPTGDSPELDAEQPELLLPRTCDESVGDQRVPALARTALPPGGALAIAWEDYGGTQGTGAGQPEVVVHYAPTHLTETNDFPRVVTESWSGETGSPWHSQWSSSVTGPVTLATQGKEGEFNALSLPGSGFTWINDHTATNVDIVTTVRFSSYTNYAGIFARRTDADPHTFVGATFQTNRPDPWRLYASIDGVVTDLATYPYPMSFQVTGIGVNVHHRLRFRAVDTLDGGIFVGMKVWRVGAVEPSAWLLERVIEPSSPLIARLRHQPGRFGLRMYIPSANGGRTYFDDFRAAFFEGSGNGNLDAVPTVPLLLRRDNATYRNCRPDAPCAEAAGCCTDDADCASSLTCASSHAAALGVGSHAATCVAAHCANSRLDSGEVRADCGGVDCPACDCTSSTAPGATGYCGASCRCGIGEMPCVRSDDCLPGLICGSDAGPPFGGALGSMACVPPHCMNRVLDATEGETAPDCGGECGSNCNTCSSYANGAAGHCRVYCPCAAGHGICRTNDECLAPLICADSRGNRFGFPSSTNVCVAAHCANNKKDAELAETGIDCGGECGVCP